MAGPADCFRGAPRSRLRTARSDGMCNNVSQSLITTAETTHARQETDTKVRFPLPAFLPARRGWVIHVRGVGLFTMTTAALVLSSCVDLTHQPAVTLTAASSGNAAALRRDGNVYFLRGWLGVWSRGLDLLARRATSELGVSAVSLGQPDWNKLATFIRTERLARRQSGPLVLAGHSMGGDDQIRVAQLLARDNIAVDLLILIDPNAPPVVPANVKRCVNFYKSQPGRDAVPIFRGVPVRVADPARTRVANIDLRTTGIVSGAESIDHFNISATTAVQDMVLAEVARTCPPKRRS